MSEEPEMVVYIKPGCPWCIDVVAWLKREGYTFRTVDVYADPEKYQEMRELSGQSSAPTMTYGELLLADFGVDELEDFVETHGIVP